MKRPRLPPNRHHHCVPYHVQQIDTIFHARGSAAGAIHRATKFIASTLKQETSTALLTHVTTKYDEIPPQTNEQSHTHLDTNATPLISDHP